MNGEADKPIAAIPTRYKGYHFRSRLEARWAVFFDAIGIGWEYEKEGYDIDGRNYLPDFYLPYFNCFVEIKPTIQHDKELYRRFPCIVNDAIILIEGSPWEYKGWWFGFVGSSGTSDDNKDANRMCKFLPPSTNRDAKYMFGCNYHQLAITRLPHDINCYNHREWFGDCGVYKGRYCPMPSYTTIFFDEIDGLNVHLVDMAEVAAKSARFERGESGAT